MTKSSHMVSDLTYRNPKKETQQRARWHILCPSEEHRSRSFAPALLFEISPPKSQCAGVRYPAFSPFFGARRW